MSQVFISYSRADRDFVDTLMMHLQMLRFDAWIDVHRIDIGRDWRRTLQLSINDSDAVIVITSNAAHQSKWVRRETDLALKSEKPIFPLLLEGTTPLPALRHLPHYDVRDRDFSKAQPGMPLREFYEALNRTIPYQGRVEKNIAEATERIAEHLSRIKTIGWMSVTSLSTWSGISIHNDEGDWVFGMVMVRDEYSEDLYKNRDYIESLGWTIDDQIGESVEINVQRKLQNTADEAQLAREIITIHELVFGSRPASLEIEWNPPD